MQRRIARLIEVDNVAPDRILAVTFTRTAAADLKRELQNMDTPSSENIRAGTLHAFCFHVLMRHDVLALFGRVPRGLLTFQTSKVSRFEMEPLIEDLGALGAFGGKRAITRRIIAFEADWARLQHEQPGWPILPLDQAFHEHLTSWLRFHRGMLIGELVPEALRYLRNNPASPVFQNYDHIIVDEYQDLNRAEQELLDILAQGRNLSIVGDVDQSIYRFRHAHPVGISDFSNRHQNVEDHNLDRCRRCRPGIVAVADNVILRNYPPGEPHRLLPLQPQPGQPQLGPATIRVVQWPSLDDEASGIASFINHLITQRGIGAGQILVLSPRRLIANEIKRYLAAPGVGIAAHSFYNDKLLVPDEAQLAMTKLQLLCAPEDRVALRYWLGFGNTSWRRVQYATLRAYCTQHNDEEPSAVLAHVVAGQLQIAGTDQLAGRFQELQNEINRLGQMNIAAMYDDLFPAGVAWADPVRELLVGKVNTVQNSAGLLDLLRTEITQPEMPPEGDFVRLMSIHKSKGLTSRVTIVVGCIHGLMPHLDDEIEAADLPDHMAEQRRLFYVALTRAREMLVLSSVASVPRRMSHQIGAVIRGGNRHAGNTIACQFLNDLGAQAPAAQHGTVWSAGGFQ
jgi:superfamily I DNA/RNA helicase